MDIETFLATSSDLWTSVDIPRNSDVGFVDASFNPPNKAHVKLARLCREVYADSYLIFMLATGNADKPSVSKDDLQRRLEMIKTMVAAEFPEDSKVGWALTTQSKFIDKARTVKQRLPKTNAVFAMGFDTLLRLGEQRFYDEPVEQVLQKLFSFVRVLVLLRKEDPLSTQHLISVVSQSHYLRGSVFAPYVDRITVCERHSDTDGVSSSFARTSKENLLAAAPPAVAAYVLKNHLYGL